MIVSLILLIALIGVGALLYFEHQLYRRRQARKALENPEAAAQEAAETPANADDEEECCGMHITCEKDSLLAAVSPDIVYYDDEELDRFIGVAPDAYSEADIEEFRDVLLTMQPDDIAGWARSLQLRHIALPDPVRDELLMIVAEARQSHAGLS